MTAYILSIKALCSSGSCWRRSSRATEMQPHRCHECLLAGQISAVMLGGSWGTKGTSDFCPWPAGSHQAQRQALPVSPSGCQRARKQVLPAPCAVCCHAVRVTTGQPGSTTAPSGSQGRETVLLHCWSTGLAAFICRLRMGICEPEIQSETGGCECHGNQSKLEVYTDPRRVRAAEFHMVLEKNSVSGIKICLCLKAAVGTSSQHLIHSRTVTCEASQLADTCPRRRRLHGLFSV